MSQNNDDVNAIQTVVRTIRKQKVILDSDLALIYGVATKALNQAVKRNIDRFPVDFMFRLTSEELAELQRSRSQFVTLNRGHNIKYLGETFLVHASWREALGQGRLLILSAFPIQQKRPDRASCERRNRQIHVMCEGQCLNRAEMIGRSR